MEALTIGGVQYKNVDEVCNAYALDYNDVRDFAEAQGMTVRMALKSIVQGNLNSQAADSELLSNRQYINSMTSGNKRGAIERKTLTDWLEKYQDKVNKRDIADAINIIETMLRQKNDIAEINKSSLMLSDRYKSTEAYKQLRAEIRDLELDIKQEELKLTTIINGFPRKSEFISAVARGKKQNYPEPHIIRKLTEQAKQERREVLSADRVIKSNKEQSLTVEKIKAKAASIWQEEIRKIKELKPNQILEILNEYYIDLKADCAADRITIRTIVLKEFRKEVDVDTKGIKDTLKNKGNISIEDMEYIISEYRTKSKLKAEQGLSGCNLNWDEIARRIKRSNTEIMLRQGLRWELAYERGTPRHTCHDSEANLSIAINSKKNYTEICKQLMNNKNSREVLREILSTEFLRIEDIYDQVDLANLLGIRLQPLRVIVDKLQKDYTDSTLNKNPQLVNGIWDMAVTEAFIKKEGR